MMIMMNMDDLILYDANPSCGATGAAVALRVNDLCILLYC